MRSGTFDHEPSAGHAVFSRRGDVRRIIDLTIDAARDEIERRRDVTVPRDREREAVRILEQLWDRRSALARLLERSRRRAAPTSSEVSAAECAGVLRRLVDQVAPDRPVRDILMSAGERVLPGCFIQARRRAVETTLEMVAPPQPALPPPAPPPRLMSDTAAFMRALQPGARLRMVILDQWTTAVVTWRSDRGHYFMFSSALGGQAHALGRDVLRRMFETGLVELEHATGAPRGPDQ